jgi:hypothetical protein
MAERFKFNDEEENIDENDALQLAAALNKNSEHPVSSNGHIGLGAGQFPTLSS